MSSRNRRPSGASRLLLGLLLLLPAGAAAQDRARIVPTLTVSQEYQTNPLSASQSSREIDDWVTRVSPSLSLISESRRGRSQFTVGSNAAIYRDLSDLNTLDPYADYDVSWNLTPRLELIGDGYYRVLDNTDPVEVAGFSVHNGRPDLVRYRLSGGTRYQLSPLSQLTASYAWQGETFDETDFSDFNRDLVSSIFSLAYQRNLTPRDQFFSNASLSFTNFGDIEVDPAAGRPNGRAEQDDTQLALLAGWSRLWSPSITTSLQGGIRVLETEGSGLTNVVFPGLEPRDLALDERSTAFVGAASIARSTARSSLEFSINQQTRPSSGRSGSIDVRTFSLGYTRQLYKRVFLRATAALSTQESASDNFAVVDRFFFFDPSGNLQSNCSGRDVGTRQPAGTQVCAIEVASAIDEDITHLNITLDWRMRRRLTTFLSYDLVDRDSSSVLGRSFNNHLIRVGVRYAYDIDVP